MTTFTMTIAQDIYNSNDEFPINLDDAWQWLGYSKKSNAKRNLERFTEGQDFCSSVSKSALGGRPSEQILLTIDCFKLLAMLAQTEFGDVARQYFLECEKIAKERSLAKPKTRRELAEENLRLSEENLKQIIQLELAESMIASLEEEVERYAEALDELYDHSSVIRVAKHNGISENNFNWRKLKAASQKLGTEIKRETCPRFGTKNLYSHDAWRLAYPGINLPETTTLVIKPE
jgi:phage anti-repressor protein